jgi:aspartate/methionine/tyrosine aminotransferase
LIAAAGIRAIEGGRLGYTPSLGISALREAIAAWYHTRYGVEVPRSRVVVTAGSSGALLLTMGALLSPHDQVLMADPGYPCNRHFVRTMEGEAVVENGGRTDRLAGESDRHADRSRRAGTHPCRGQGARRRTDRR